MQPRRSCRARVASPSRSPVSELPLDVLLEIAFRAGFTALLRFAATCKLLRRAIRSPDFARRVRDGIDEPSRLLCFLDTESTDTPFCLLHPETPAAASLVENHLAPFVSRVAAGLLDKYKPVASRGGLVLLERKRFAGERWRAPPSSDICVYDPLTNRRAFLPFPPDIHRDDCTFALLTAADGIGVGGCSSFLLLAVGTLGLGNDMPLRVQTVRSEADGKWGPLTCSYHPDLPNGRLLEQHENNSTAVVLDCVVHWLMSSYILTYNVGASAAAAIRFPWDLLPAEWAASRSCLGSSPDGRLILVYMQESGVSVLVRSAGGGWARSIEVNANPALRWLMAPREQQQRRRTSWVELESSGDHRTGAVLMRFHVADVHEQLVVLDMETKQLRGMVHKWGVPYEVDLVSRLCAAKML